MANVDKRNGFNLITGGGRQPRRQRRFVDSANTNNIMPGDGYIIEADGGITRATAGNVAVNGIMEAVDLPGAGIAQGPTTYDYIPGSVGVQLYIIGIEDDDAEFAVVTTGTITQDEYDAAAKVDLVDTTGNVPLRQSRQAVGDVGGDQFSLVRPVDTPSNDPYAQYALVVVKLLPASIQ